MKAEISDSEPVSVPPVGSYQYNIKSETLGWNRADIMCIHTPDIVCVRDFLFYVQKNLYNKAERNNSK